MAIKKITDVFDDLTDAKRILREMKLLRHLGVHENIINVGPGRVDRAHKKWGCYYTDRDVDVWCRFWT